MDKDSLSAPVMVRQPIFDENLEVTAYKILYKDLEAAKVEALAESILEEGQRTLIQVRPDKERYVLVTGLHRLEAVKALGEESIQALVVRTGELLR